MKRIRGPEHRRMTEDDIPMVIPCYDARRCSLHRIKPGGIRVNFNSPWRWRSPRRLRLLRRTVPFTSSILVTTAKGHKGKKNKRQGENTKKIKRQKKETLSEEQEQMQKRKTREKKKGPKNRTHNKTRKQDKKRQRTHLKDQDKSRKG